MDPNSDTPKESKNGEEDDNSTKSFITCRTIREKNLYFCNICNKFMETLTLAKDHVRSGHMEKNIGSSSSSGVAGAAAAAADQPGTNEDEKSEVNVECDDCHQVFETELQLHRHRLRVHLSSRRNRRTMAKKKKNDQERPTTTTPHLSMSRKVEKTRSSSSLQKSKKAPAQIIQPTNNGKGQVPKKENLITNKIIAQKSLQSSTPSTTINKNNNNNAGSSSFMCAICQKRYGFKRNLKQHLLNIHQRKSDGGEKISAKKSTNKTENRSSSQRKIEERKKVQKMPKLMIKTDGVLANKTKPVKKNKELQILPSTCVTRLGPKLFKCNLCQRRCPALFKAIEHVLTHTACQPFECGICQKKFSRKGNLQRHQRNIHHPTGNRAC